MFSSPIIIIWTMTIFAFVLMVPLFGMLSRYAILHGIYDYPDPQYGAPTVMSFFNLFGFVALFLFGIGWGNVIHIDPTRINRPYKTAKTVLAYLATPLLTLAGAIMLLIPGLLISSRACVYAALNLFLQTHVHPFATESMSMLFHENVHAFNGCSSYAITGTLFFLACVMMLWSLFCAYGIWSLCDALMYQFFPHGIGHTGTLEPMIFLPLIICYLSGNFIALSGLKIITLAIEIFSYYLGV